MDYTISRLTQNGSTTVAVIHTSIGAITTEDEWIPSTTTTGAVYAANDLVAEWRQLLLKIETRPQRNKSEEVNIRQQ